MNKTEILQQIDRRKVQLNTAKRRLRELEDQYQTLEVFSEQCQARIRGFEESIQRRKGKLLRLDGVLGKVRTARRYREKMNLLLVGTEYIKAANDLGNLENSIAGKKRNVRNEIMETEDRITYLENVIEHLQYEYRACLEEDAENG